MGGAGFQKLGKGKGDCCIFFFFSAVDVCLGFGFVCTIVGGMHLI